MSGIAEEVRKNILAVLANEAVPAVEAFLDKFAAGVKAEAANETGWCKVRDAVVIPYGMRSTVSKEYPALRFAFTKSSISAGVSDSRRYEPRAGLICRRMYTPARVAAREPPNTPARIR